MQWFHTTQRQRRLTRKSLPKLEVLEDRRCPTSVNLIGNALTVQGDNTDNTVYIEQNDDANTVQVTYDAGSQFLRQRFPSNSVQTISVALQNGNDYFRYDLESDTQWGKMLSVSLGSNGYKQADVNLDALATHTLHADFGVTVRGDSSGDIINFDATATAPVNIDPGVMLRAQLTGAEVNALYWGQLNGYLDMRVGASAPSVVDLAILRDSFGAVAGRLDPGVAFNANVEEGSLIGYFDTPVPLASAPEYSVTVNGVGLTRTDLQNLEQQLRVLDPTHVGLRWLPGQFWYDTVSGAVGLMGQGTSGFLPAGLDLGGPLPVDASYTPGTAHTGVFVNGREITQHELDFLSQLISAAPPGAITLGNGNSYVILSDGTVYNVTDPVHRVNLITLAEHLGHQPRSGPLSTYDLTGISVLSDGSFLGILDHDGP